MGKVSQKLWEAESKLPDAVKKHTDKLIRGGHRLAKKIQPIREDSKRRGEKWVKSQRKKLHI